MPTIVRELADADYKFKTNVFCFKIIQYPLHILIGHNKAAGR